MSRSKTLHLRFLWPERKLPSPQNSNAEPHMTATPISEVRWRKLGDPFGQYVVSSNGDVERVLAPHERKVSYVPIAPAWNYGAHSWIVYLHDGSGGRSRFFVHVLTTIAFLGPKPKGQVIVHLDGDHRNVALDNLAYMTRSSAAVYFRELQVEQESVPVADPLLGGVSDKS